MSLFEFIAGMISVILALAVAHMFNWWSLWTFRDLSWNFGSLARGPSSIHFE
jgi:hypothetical protein